MDRQGARRAVHPPAYLLFLFVVAVVHYALPSVRLRTIWLLAASYAFYLSISSRWWFVLVGVTFVGYMTGVALHAIRRREPDCRAERLKSAVLAVGVVLVVGVLAVFKYADLASGVEQRVLQGLSFNADLPLLGLLISIGVSFWTFATVAYMVDVGRGEVPAELDPLRYALYVALFAHVTAGPIARGGQLLTQLADKRRFSYERMRSGLWLIAELVERKGARLCILVVPTAPPGSLAHTASYTAEALRRDHPDVVFPDLSGPEGLPRFLGKSDFSDRGHLNVVGAEKLAQVLGVRLRETYGLPDRRGDATYAGWDRDLELYDAFVANERSREETSGP